MRRSLLLSVLATSSLIAAGVVVALPAHAAVTFSSTAVAQNSQRCMDVFGAQTGNNVNLIQWGCHGGSNQSFAFTPVAGTTDQYEIRTFSGRCVDVSGASTADSARIDQWDCQSVSNQRFRLVAVAVSGTDKTFNLQAVHSGKCVAVNGASTADGATLIQLPCAASTDRVWRVPNFTPDGGGATPGYEPLPALPYNVCNNTSLPRTHGTNFATPDDPYAQGFKNQTAIGWDGNWYPAFSYLSGSYFARGVPNTYNNLCGAMYSFSAYRFGLTSGQNVPAQSVSWTQDSGYLPAMRTSFTRNSVGIAITNFAYRTTIGGNTFLLVYTRISVTNNSSASVTVPPGGSGLNLVRLTSAGDTVAVGQTVNHDFVAAVDRFGGSYAFPSTSALSSGALSYDTAYAAMASYWNGRVGETAQFSLPNLTLPNTGLANPGTALSNAVKAGTIYNLMVQVGKAQFSAANNYAWLLNHDVPGELVAKFSTGDFHDAQNLLLTARISEQPGFDGLGANWYWDGVWKTPWLWGVYLAKTNDTAFVTTYFNDSQTQWGPSLRTIMRTHYAAQLDTDGTLKSNFDNDSTGRWLFSNLSALIGLASYKYIATRIGNTAEATWADTAYNSLLNALNTVIGRNQSTNGFNYLPCEVDKPNTANRCNTYNDANWASPAWGGQNQWDVLLSGGAMSGIIGDPGQIDRMYQWGFDRIAGRIPFPSFGAFPGYTTAYNTAYSDAGLFSNTYRDLPITSYAWQLQNTTGGPNAEWEASGSGPSASNPWIGNHTGPQFGAVPYAWPIAHQQLGLLRSIVAEGLTSSGSGPYTYTRPIYIGRGIPNTWVAAGQSVSVSNITSGYDIGGGARSTYGVSIGVTKPGTGRVITVSLTGTPPGGAVLISLPVFLSSTVASVTGGSYDSASHTVTAASGATTVTVTLTN